MSSVSNSNNNFGKMGEAKAAQPLDKCRLHLLNNDCLLRIFEYVPTIDLILNVSNVDKNFKKLIYEHIIPITLLDFNDLQRYWRARKLFKMFGKKMQRIKITLKTFPLDYFLALIVKYCEPKQLIEINLSYLSKHIFDLSIPSSALPYLSELKKLTLSGKLLVNFMRDLCRYPEFNPTVLTLKNIVLHKTWRNSRSLENLETIQVYQTRLAPSFKIVSFLKNKTKLKSFEYVGPTQDNNRDIIATIMNFEHLQTYAFFDTSRRNDKERFLAMRYPPSMKHLSITSYTSNGVDIHLWLANQHALETLNIQINSRNAPIYDNFALEADMQASGSKWLAEWNENSFEKLTSVGIWITYGLKNSDLKQFSELTYIFQFLSRLKNLKKVSVHSSRCIGNFDIILSFVPYIQTLSIAGIRGKQNEFKEFIRALEGLEYDSARRHRIHLIINRKQHTIIRVICRFILHIQYCRLSIIILMFFILVLLSEQFLRLYIFNSESRLL